MVQFWMLVGVAGSGKSTFAKELKERINGKIFSSDGIREEIYGDASIQDNPQKVFSILHKRIKEAMKNGENVIYDACNLSAKRRKAFINEIKNIECFKACTVICSDYESCIKNQEKRDRKVPEYVIKRQILSFEIPTSLEGWNYIEVKKAFCNFSLEDELFKSISVPHDNPHHNLSIGEHMLKTEKLARDGNNYPEFFLLACRYHDIGKRFCKSFKNSKGQISNIAHYYNHQNVSSYFILTSKELDEMTSRGVATIVQHHMAPYLMTEESFKRKYGDAPFLYAYIKSIHKYDSEAH